MRIRCTVCDRVITIPPERTGNPRLKVKCGCTAVFLLADARRVDETEAAAAPAPRPARVERAPSPPAPASTGMRLKPLEAPLPLEPEPPPAAADWRVCLNHADRTSDHVCPACRTGYCAACLQEVRGAGICPKCDGLCVKPSAYGAGREREAQRDRSLLSELPVILAYPFQDPVAYVMLAAFVGIFAVAARFALMGGWIALLLSQGVLMAYCFYALSRVADGDLQSFMPDLSDISDLVRPLRLGAAAFLASSGPLLLVLFLGPGLALFRGLLADGSAAPTPVVHAAQPPEEVQIPAPVSEAEPPAPGLGDISAGVLLLIVMASLWKLVYAPVALTVAGLSRSALSTLNPLIGISTIRSMGSTYWQAMGIYTAIAVAQSGAGLALGIIPLAGPFIRSFVDAYAYLAIGCTLGMAVMKKARELGYE